MRRYAVLLLLASLLGACVQETKVIYVLPEAGSTGDADAGAISWTDVDPGDGGGAPKDATTASDAHDAGAVDGALPDTSLPEPQPEPQPEPPPDVQDEPAPEIVFPDTSTNDCDPLGVPERWEGTFDGETVSNIPDMGGYTFEGPVYGSIFFEIKCYEQKYVVYGELDGDSTNCALASGCPFTALLSGYYDPVEHRMHGELLQGVIDFTLVKVFAEGSFEGDLIDGAELNGTWEGEKTTIEPASLSWVEAAGAGTWEAYPVE
jgi:hypothetical protein